MVRMISPNAISFRATVTEDEIRARLSAEVLESINALGPDGKPLPGVSVKVNRGNGRAGGYTVDVSGPMPVQMTMLPRGTDVAN